MSGEAIDVLREDPRRADEEVKERRQRHQRGNHVPDVQTEQFDGVGEVSGAGCLGEVGGSHGERGVICQQQNCDAGDARSTGETLPMSKWWEIDVYPLAAPVVAGGAL